MMKKVNIDEVMRILAAEFPKWQVPVSELIEAQTKDPFKVLVATLLAAQTRDQVTAVVAKKLFAEVDTYQDLAAIDDARLQALIRPVSYYKTKTRHLKLLAKMLGEEFSGQVPTTLDELTRLPGVGRKTASIVLTSCFQKPAIAVDAHVHRISNRFGYVRTKTRLETEMRLRQKLPQKYWLHYNMFLVALGQQICHPTSPKCSICPLAGECNRIGVTRSR